FGFSDLNYSPRSVSNSVFSARRRSRRRITLRKEENQEKAASYSRYSSQNQREESIQQQQEVCRQKAISIGHSISCDLEFIDRAVSGTKLNRDGLNQLMKSAENGEFNVLYLYSLSRLARESVITMPILKKLVHTYKIRCICVTEGIDTAVTGWELIASIYSIIHEQFIADLRAAVLRGQEGALLEGFSVGDWCFGYGSEPVPGTEQTRPGRNRKPRMIYVINEEHAEWVNQIFTWYVDEGYSIGRIVRELNRLRAPKDHRSTSDEWHHNLVVGILSNEKYIGLWPWGENQNERDPETGIIRQESRLDEECEKWTRELPHLCIVDTRTFQKAQEMLNANTEKWEKHRRDNGRLNGSSAETNGRRRVKLLHGLLKCAKCGSPFYNTGRRTQCRGARRGTCDVVTSVPMEVLEAMIVEKIGEIINGDELWFDYTLNELIRCYQEYESRVPAAIRGIERVLQQVSQKIQRLLDRIEAGDISHDINVRLQRRNEERETLQEQLASLQRGRVQDREAPTAVWLREQLSSMHEDLQVSSPTANESLRNLIGGEIVLEEIDIPLRRRKALRGTFSRRAHGVSGDIVDLTPVPNGPEHVKLISIDFIQPDPADLQREVVMQMYNEGEPQKNIA
ncbi:MAG: recombinase family protein, partial [Planctomycetaceae bacterium]|nr:recombinase family protein [Planctomycetaceae bacterium]